MNALTKPLNSLVIMCLIATRVFLWNHYSFKENQQEYSDEENFWVAYSYGLSPEDFVNKQSTVIQGESHCERYELHWKNKYVDTVTSCEAP